MLITQAAGLRAPPHYPGLPQAPQDLVIDEVQCRALRGEREIDSIRHLRDELKLPESVRTDPLFHRLEKKGMRKALSARSSSVTP